MALKKPLTLYNGVAKQLQDGDDLDVPISGATVISLTNDNAGTIAPGAPVYLTASGHFNKSKADAAGTSMVVGLVAKSGGIATGVSGEVATEGVLSLSTALWDAITGQSGGLTFGARYWVNKTTAGLLTSDGSTFVTGDFVCLVGIALSTTEMKIKMEAPIGL